jgi:hypothetical protein
MIDWPFAFGYETKRHGRSTQVSKTTYLIAGKYKREQKRAEPHSLLQGQSPMT